MTDRILFISVLFIAILVSSMVLFVSNANANPASIVRCGTSSTATSTYNKVSAGIGTTTITCNVVNGNIGYDSAKLDLIENASTSAPMIGVRIEHSYDGINWYAETPVTSTASTTPIMTALEVAFATTSDTQYGSPGSGAIGLTTGDRVMRTLDITTPTAYTRVVLFGVSGSGSVYGEITAKQQVR